MPLTAKQKRELAAAKKAKKEAAARANTCFMSLQDFKATMEIDKIRILDNGNGPFAILEPEQEFDFTVAGNFDAQLPFTILCIMDSDNYLESACIMNSKDNTIAIL